MLNVVLRGVDNYDGNIFEGYDVRSTGWLEGCVNVILRQGGDEDISNRAGSAGQESHLGETCR